MTWLEMSRDPDHGGAGWGFGVCLWSPTEKKGGGKWGYWELMQRVRKGDAVVHLQGRHKAQFVGYSTADADCYITSHRPPNPGEWHHANTFYRVPLTDFHKFDAPVNLSDVFTSHAERLVQYHEAHSPASKTDGRYLFYVPQSGKLQCQNGAYLTEMDEQLANIIFSSGIVAAGGGGTVTSVATDQGVASLKVRIGQDKFSNEVRNNYCHSCCFPGCTVDESRFLVGAHIARWSDSAPLRGQVSNGICLCLMHDKAFEAGLFTLDLQGRVHPNPNRVVASGWATENIIPFMGQHIKAGKTRPSEEALREHWGRIGYSPSTSIEAKQDGTAQAG